MFNFSIIDQLIKLKLKPAIKKQFGFDDVFKCNVSGDYTTDEMVISAEGILSGEHLELYAKPVKLSENSGAVDIFIEKVKEQIKYKKLYKAVLIFDFKSGNIQTTVFYLSLNDEKLKETFDTKF